MAKQTINIGASANDGTGTPLRTSFDYCNLNFTELYTAVGPSGNNIVCPGSATITGNLTVGTNITSTSGKFATASSGQTVGLQLDSFVAGGAFNNYILNNDSSAGTIAALNFGRLTSLLYGFIRTNNSSQNLQLGTSGATGSVEFLLNNSTAMTLNSNGLGVGATPSAWASIYKPVEFPNGSSIWGQTDIPQLSLQTNAFLNSSFQWIYKTTDAASNYRQTAGTHLWFTAPSGTAGNVATLTQRMQLDVNGNLILLSSNTPATLSNNGELTVNATSNTNLRFSYRGSDGTTRVANITLA